MYKNTGQQHKLVSQDLGENVFFIPNRANYGKKRISKNMPQILMPLKYDAEKIGSNGGKPSLQYRFKKKMHTVLTLSIPTTGETLLPLFLLFRHCQ